MHYIIIQAWKQQERDQEFINQLKSGARLIYFKWPKVFTKSRHKTPEKSLEMEGWINIQMFH